VSAPALDGQYGIAEHSHVGARDLNLDTHSHRIGSRDPQDHLVPLGREEQWRFTPLRRIRGLHDETPLTGSDFTVTVNAPEGVVAHSVTGEQAAALKGASNYLPTDRPSARAWAASDAVFLVDVPADLEVDGLIEIVFRGGSVDEAVAAHLLVRLGTHSKAQVSVVYEGSSTLTENVEIVVADGAHLDIASRQSWSADAVHLSHHHVRVGRDAVVRHAALTFGGDLVRIVATVEYDGPGGDAELLGLYIADAGQHLEHRLLMDHGAPNCRSRALYKGALQGQGAHTVWVGDVLIRPTAEGTDTYEMNRNLLLTEGARADSIPNLEIETGEIAGAGHASATGKFDDEQLFYLLSRGIPEAAARRLVVRGFFGEVLARLGIPAVVESTNEIIEGELEISGI